MSNRRTFLKTSLAVAAGLAVSRISPVWADSTSLPKGIVYTRKTRVNGQRRSKGIFQMLK